MSTDNVNVESQVESQVDATNATVAEKPAPVLGTGLELINGKPVFRDGQGRLINGHGELINEKGQRINPDGSLKRKRSKGGKKKRKDQWAKMESKDGETKLTSPETPGFIVGKHAMLKESDFIDDGGETYARWKIWYYQQFVRNAEKNLEDILASGPDVETRKKNRQNAKVAAEVREKMASGDPAFMAMMAKIYAEMMASGQMPPTA